MLICNPRDVFSPGMMIQGPGLKHAPGAQHVGHTCLLRGPGSWPSSREAIPRDHGRWLQQKLACARGSADRIGRAGSTRRPPAQTPRVRRRLPARGLGPFHLSWSSLIRYSAHGRPVPAQLRRRFAMDLLHPDRDWLPSALLSCAREEIIAVTWIAALSLCYCTGRHSNPNVRLCALD